MGRGAGLGIYDRRASGLALRVRIGVTTRGCWRAAERVARLSARCALSAAALR